LNFRKFRKNAKALSPVIATIILIAVTVAVSVVVAAWMGALTIGFMGNSEQVAITNTQYVSNAAVNATVQNTGSATVTIVGAYIDGKAVGFVGYPAGSGTASSSIAKGTTSVFTLTLPTGSTFTNTAQYTLKLQTAKGNAITTTYTYTGS
jgi:flagellin-like protein